MEKPTEEVNSQSNDAKMNQQVVEDDRISLPPHLQDSNIQIRTGPINFHQSGKLKALQAVVLAAGSGSRMTTLVSNTPKCLLPIATIPMLFYPLQILQRSGFTGENSSEIVILCINRMSGSSFLIILIQCTCTCTFYLSSFVYFTNLRLLLQSVKFLLAKGQKLPSPAWQGNIT